MYEAMYAYSSSLGISCWMLDRSKSVKNVVTFDSIAINFPVYYYLKKAMSQEQVQNRNP